MGIPDLLSWQRQGKCMFVQAASSDEGGVAAGFAVLDSPFLQD